MKPITDIVKGLVKGGAEGILSGAKGIIESFVADPDKKLEAMTKLKELELSHEKNMAEIDVKLEEIDAKKIESVNQTMREESKSEHFMQWAWRPSVGFMFVLIGLNNYVVLPYFKNKGLLPIDIPSEMFMAILAILGVASWHRGVKKVEEAKTKK